MDGENDSRRGFFRGGLDIPDYMAGEIYGEAPPATAPEGGPKEASEMRDVVKRNARYIASGRKNPAREDDTEALLCIYDRKPEFRARVLWALGEMGCSEAAVMIIGIARNWERHIEKEPELVGAAVVALGKIDASGQSVCILLNIAGERSLPEGLREKAAISAESVAARRGSAELSRIRIKLEECGARRLPEVQKWLKRNEPKRQPTMQAIPQKGGTC